MRQCVHSSCERVVGVVGARITCAFARASRQVCKGPKTCGKLSLLQRGGENDSQTFKNRTQCKQVSLFGKITRCACLESHWACRVAGAAGAARKPSPESARMFTKFIRNTGIRQNSSARSFLVGWENRHGGSKRRKCLFGPLASVGLTDAACLRGLNLELRLLTRLRSRSQLRTPILNGIPGQHILVSQSRNAT